MAFSRDSLSTIAQRIKANFELRVRDENGDAVDAHTRGTGYTEECEVLAGVVYELQGRQAYIADQILIKTASEDTLVSKAIEWGIPRVPPSFASGALTVTGDNGQVINSERVLQHSGGAQFRTLGDATIVAGVATLSVRALTPGVAGNLPAGESLTFVTPIAGVDSSAIVDAPGLTAGADIESRERLRTRLQERAARQPMGGKFYDYIMWAKAAHVDVTRVFPFFHEGEIGNGVIRFVTEDLSTPIPTAAHVTAVDDYIQLVRPSGMSNLIVEAPSAAPLDLVFTSLSPNTPAVQAAIDAEIADLIRREGACDGTLPLSHIREAISNAPGEFDFDITLAADFVTAPNQFPTLGVTTWPGA